MPQNTERVPTLVDWYLIDESGNLFGRDKLERKIKKAGRLDYPSHKLGIVGKVFYAGDVKDDCKPYYARILSIQCIGQGGFRIITDRNREFILYRKNILEDEDLNELR